MKSKIIAGVVVALIIIGGGVGYVLTREDKPVAKNQVTQNGQDTTKTSSGTGEETQVQSNLQTLRTGGKAQVCTMSYSADDGNGTGKMYTDGKGRGRLQIDLTTARGNQGQSNTLITNEKIYSWTKTDGGSFGFVFDASTIKPDSTGSPTTSNSQTAGKNFDLKCQDWSVDEAVLTIPTDVNFSALPSGQ